MIFDSILNIPDWRQSKTLILSTNVDKKWLETEFSIAIRRPTGDKWQLKILFLAIFVSGRRLLRAFSMVANMYPVRFTKVVINFKILRRHCNLDPKRIT